ncbi:hypothetical protein RESH_04213 [Rhodopirellula europaea SH398]|uniref:Uncharacterized protein n=1 Tax=Rhodopirellula europaea SH398 TaxID=1263868 RepID=M5S164_9BACT|nr:hypothetical protein RESH_04213 [Rhodopirellula europaea SH398]
MPVGYGIAQWRLRDLVAATQRGYRLDYIGPDSQTRWRQHLGESTAPISAA